MLQTMSQTKTNTNSTTALTVVAVVVGAAGIAMALLPFFRTTGYQNFSVQCYDGSFITSNNTAGTYQDVAIMNNSITFIGFGCQDKNFYTGLSENFCDGKTNTNTGKAGVNSFSISKKCKLISPRPYGYGYGYNYIRDITPR